MKLGRKPKKGDLGKMREIERILKNFAIEFLLQNPTAYLEF